MVPEGSVGLIMFLAFIAPGALFELLVATGRPRPADTTFREINRVVLVSVLASALAVGLALMPRLVEPGWLEALVDSVRTGGDYWRDHLAEVAAGGGLVLFLAFLIAGLLGLAWVRGGPGGSNYEESQWYLVFRRICPEGARPYVIAVSSSGERHYGNVIAYSQDVSDPAVRDITLGEPLHWQSSVESPRRPLRGVKRVVLSGDQASKLYVTYVKTEVDAAI